MHGATGSAFASYISHALSRGADGQGGIPQLGVDVLGVLSGFRAGEQLPGKEGMKGVIWRSTWVYFSNIFRGLLMFRVLGSFSFRCLLCLGIQATMEV